MSTFVKRYAVKTLPLSTLGNNNVYQLFSVSTSRARYNARTIFVLHYYLLKQVVLEKWKKAYKSRWKNGNLYVNCVGKMEAICLTER